MTNTIGTTNLTQWTQLLEQQQEESLLTLLCDAPIIEIAEFLSQQPSQKALSLLTQLPQELQGAVFADFETGQQLALYKLLSKKEFAHIFSHIPSHQRTAFYQHLAHNEQIRLLPYLYKKDREDVMTLSAYPPETAGGIMSTDFATVIENMQVKQAIQKLREDSPSKKMIYYIYVVDQNMQMIGFVSLKDLIMAAPDEQVTHIVHENFVYANITDDRESVARQIEKYDLVAIPILNEEKQLVGIVRYDDAMDVIREEETEDMERFMGIVSNANEDTSDYLSASSLQHFRKRVTWIVGLFMASILSELIIHKHEALLGRLTVLALYLPMIAGAGGNAGSQAATVVIRALSLGQVTLRNWLGVVLKETKVAFLLAFCLFFLAFLKVIILSGNVTVENHSAHSLAFVIALSLSLQVITSTVVGASLPLIAKYFNGDPAVAASPAITTLVDITGMAIYFTIAVVMLR
ncbi:MAG: magnesium transporter [Bacteroidota bacterium]